MLHINTVHVQRETLWVKQLAGEQCKISAWACKHTYIAESFVGLCTHSSVWKVSSVYRGECDLKCDLQTSLLLSVSCMHGRFSNIHYFIAGRESCFTCRYLLPFPGKFCIVWPGHCYYSETCFREVWCKRWFECNNCKAFFLPTSWIPAWQQTPGANDPINLFSVLDPLLWSAG